MAADPTSRSHADLFIHLGRVIAAAHTQVLVEVCGSSIFSTRPVPVPDDAYPYPTRAKNCYPTRPAGIPVPVAYP